MGQNPRRAAVEALVRVHREGGYSNLVMESLLDKSPLREEDRAFASRLFYGVIERRLTLDYILAAHSSMKLKKREIEALTAKIDQYRSARSEE